MSSNTQIKNHITCPQSLGNIFEKQMAGEGFFFLMEAIPMCLGIIRMKQYLSNTTMHIYYLDWQHVLTSQGHHQAFIVNQLMFLGSKGSQECMQLSKH
jgi:hypothetical protein